MLRPHIREGPKSYLEERLSLFRRACATLNLLFDAEAGVLQIIKRRVSMCLPVSGSHIPVYHINSACCIKYVFLVTNTHSNNKQVIHCIQPILNLIPHVLSLFPHILFLLQLVFKTYCMAFLLSFCLKLLTVHTLSHVQEV